MSPTHGREDLHLLLESLGKQIERAEIRLSKQIEEVAHTIEVHIQNDERKFDALEDRVGDQEILNNKHEHNWNIVGWLFSFIGFSGLGAAIAYLIDLASRSH